MRDYQRIYQRISTMSKKKKSSAGNFKYRDDEEWSPKGKIKEEKKLRSLRKSKSVFNSFS